MTFNLTLLNHYTMEVMKEASSLETVGGWELAVAADSDVVLQNRRTGVWFGITMHGIDPAKRTWRLHRGCLSNRRRVTKQRWVSLREAVQALCAEVEP